VETNTDPTANADAVAVNTETLEAILDRVDRIHGWVKFFGVMAVIGLILGVMAIISESSAQSSTSSSSSYCLLHPSSVLCD